MLMLRFALQQTVPNCQRLSCLTERLFFRSATPHFWCLLAFLYLSLQWMLLLRLALQLKLCLSSFWVLDCLSDCQCIWLSFCMQLYGGCCFYVSHCS